MKKLVLLIASLAIAAAPAWATLDGSSAVLVGPGSANPGDTVELCFSVENGSPDGEAIREVRLTLPEDSDILSGYYDDAGQGWNFDFSIGGDYDNVGFFIDADGNPGEIAPGQMGYFYLTVFLHHNMDCGQQELAIKLYGDDTGDAPHWIRIYDYLDVCGVATEGSTWSSVKGLY